MSVFMGDPEPYQILLTRKCWRRDLELFQPTQTYGTRRLTLNSKEERKDVNLVPYLLSPKMPLWEEKMHRNSEQKLGDDSRTGFRPLGSSKYK